jgi:hypothetical protein
MDGTVEEYPPEGGGGLLVGGGLVDPPYSLLVRVAIIMTNENGINIQSKKTQNR